MTDIRDLDRRYVFHPFSAAHGHEQSGAVMMARSAEGRSGPALSPPGGIVMVSPSN